MDSIVFLMQGLMVKFPVVMSVIAVMGICRAVLKPAFAFGHAVVAAIPGDKDDKLLQAAEESKIIKGVFFVLDWLFSAKLIK